jgi:hypothetical protein
MTSTANDFDPFDRLCYFSVAYTASERHTLHRGGLRRLLATAYLAHDPSGDGSSILSSASHSEAAQVIQVLPDSYRKT